MKSSVFVFNFILLIFFTINIGASEGTSSNLSKVHRGNMLCSGTVGECKCTLNSTVAKSTAEGRLKKFKDEVIKIQKDQEQEPLKQLLASESSQVRIEQMRSRQLQKGQKSTFFSEIVTHGVWEGAALIITKKYFSNDCLGRKLQLGSWKILSNEMVVRMTLGALRGFARGFVERFVISTNKLFMAGLIGSASESGVIWFQEQMMQAGERAIAPYVPEWCKNNKIITYSVAFGARLGIRSLIASIAMKIAVPEKPFVVQVAPSSLLYYNYARSGKAVDDGLTIFTYIITRILKLKKQ